MTNFVNKIILFVEPLSMERIEGTNLREPFAHNIMFVVVENEGQTQQAREEAKNHKELSRRTKKSAREKKAFRQAQGHWCKHVVIPKRQSRAYCIIHVKVCSINGIFITGNRPKRQC